MEDLIMAKIQNNDYLNFSLEEKEVMKNNLFLKSFLKRIEKAEREAEALKPYEYSALDEAKYEYSQAYKSHHGFKNLPPRIAQMTSVEEVYKAMREDF